MKKADIAVTYIDHMGSDLSVVNAARVSFDKESSKMEDKDARLIRYLAEHEHNSPFNHTFITVRVKAPVFVARQLVKHKFMPWNEVSRRYVDSEPEFYIPDVWRKRGHNVKQGSSDEGVDGPWVDASKASMEETLRMYNDLLSSGVCPEQARMVLPQSMMTEWYWSGTLGAFANMCRLRLDAHTQKETREVAQKISDIITPLFPVSWRALMGEGK